MAENTPSAPPSPRRADGLLLTIILTLYASTAPSWILGGDTAEFATVGAVGGVAHPPGYPLYTLLLRATSWLPTASPAHTAALLSALMGVAALGLGIAAARAWGASVIASRFAALIIAVSPLVWSLNTQSEVFAMNTMFVAAIAWVSAPEGPLRGSRRVAALGLIAGLALSNHHSAVMWAPLGLTAAIIGLTEASSRLKAAALGVAALVLGLTPYAHLLTASGPWEWGDTSTLSGLWQHFTRADYGTTQLSLGEEARQPLAQLTAFAARVARELLWLPLVAVLWGGVELFKRARGRSAKALATAWVASWCAAGPLFVTLFNLPPQGWQRFIIERFYMMPLVLLLIPLALGLDPLITRLTNRLGPEKTHRAAIGGLAIVALLGVPRALDHLDASQSPAVHHYVLNALQSAPEDAVIIGQGDHLIFGFLYAQSALQLRDDVLYIDVPMLAYDWYHDAIESKLGVPVRLRAQRDHRGAMMVVDAMQSGRPVFMITMLDPLITRAYVAYPFGGLLRVVQPANAPPPSEVVELNVRLFASFELGYAFPSVSDSWAGGVHTNYGQTWLTLARALQNTDKRLSAEALARTRILAPWLLETPP